MPNCKNCGQEISQRQYANFNGFCPHCVRAKPIQEAAEHSKKSESREWIFWGVIMLMSGIFTPIFIMGSSPSIPNAGLFVLFAIGIAIIGLVIIITNVSKK